VLQAELLLPFWASVDNAAVRTRLLASANFCRRDQPVQAVVVVCEL
jgi:hypothetical protein